MMWLGGYELLVIAALAGLLAFGPPLAGLALAFVRRRRRRQPEQDP